jgi:hypothetical protein
LDLKNTNIWPTNIFLDEENLDKQLDKNLEKFVDDV